MSASDDKTPTVARPRFIPENARGRVIARGGGTQLNVKIIRARVGDVGASVDMAHPDAPVFGTSESGNVANYGVRAHAGRAIAAMIGTDNPDDERVAALVAASGTWTESRAADPRGVHTSIARRWVYDPDVFAACGAPDAATGRTFTRIGAPSADCQRGTGGRMIGPDMRTWTGAPAACWDAWVASVNARTGDA